MIIVGTEYYLKACAMISHDTTHAVIRIHTWHLSLVSKIWEILGNGDFAATCP